MTNTDDFDELTETRRIEFQTNKELVWGAPRRRPLISRQIAFRARSPGRANRERRASHRGEAERRA